MSSGRLARTPRLLIFDLDGTLVDSRDAIARSFNAALGTAGVAPVPHDQVYPMIGIPLAHMFTRHLPAEHAHRLQGCIEAYRAHQYEVEIPRQQPFPGVLETLAACRAAGCTLTVATTKIQAVADVAVDTAGLRGYFSLVLGGDSVAFDKPHPALVLHSLQRLGFAAGDALVVGDSSFDMKMASGAGVVACGVTYGVHSAETLRAAGASWLIDAMPELLPLIGLGG